MRLIEHNMSSSRDPADKPEAMFSNLEKVQLPTKAHGATAVIVLEQDNLPE